VKKFYTPTDRIVPMHHPRVLLELSVVQGADRDGLLENTGIRAEMFEDPEARISYLQFGVLIYNALELTKNPSLGIDLGRQIHLSHLGMLGLAVMSAPDIGSALEVALRHYRTVAPLWNLSIELRDQHAVLNVSEVIPVEQPYLMFATESLLTAFEGQAQSLYGGPLPELEINLNYPRPAHAARYTEIRRARVNFDQPVTQLVFERAILTRPIATADPLTARLAERHFARDFARDLATADAADTADGLAGQVRQLLNSAPGEYPGLDEISKLLQKSARSLRRGLQTMGTSYQRLLDDVRRAHALELATSTAMTAEQMARQLGFSDVRSFRRAFVRWTGFTPQVFRERRTAQDP
jgi:AraC-like DNA-binding protein